MPLVRFELKNEYGLGDSRLYRGARMEEEDPRNILGGFAVSGLVGILRQLGDLAEFAAVVFHDVHQQVLATAARGHKVLKHIKKIEAALPQFEKSVQEQKSHIHFAYITGCDWHANIQTGHSELLGSDLPEFMIDSYEECRDPPHLHLLDKFDRAGSGACVKRYSDPSYFWRVMASSESIMVGKAYSGKKVRRKKKQRLGGRNVLARHSVHMTLHSKSSNNSASYAPAVTNELKFSIDDPSTSDTLSASGFANDLMHFSPDKQSGCLAEQNVPSSVSNELYGDDRPAIEAKTKHDVDRALNNYSEVSVSDHVMLNSLYSTSINGNGTTKMVISDNLMLSLGISKEAIDNPKAAELSSALSNENHGTDGLGVQRKLVSKSLIWDKTDSAMCDEENENMEPTSCRFLDEISSSRSSYLIKGQLSDFSSQLDKNMAETNTLGTKIQKKIEHQTGGVMLSPHLDWQCEVNMSSDVGTQFTPSVDGVNGDTSPFRPWDSDSLLLALERSNQHSETIGTEMLNQEDDLPTTMVGIGELTSQLDKQMDATSALHSKVKAKFEYQSGQGMTSLPRLNYNEMECETDRIACVISPSFVEFGGDIIPFRPHESGLFLSPETSNQGNFLLNTAKMVEPSLLGGKIRECISELDEHMNATNASKYKVHTNFGDQTGEIILLPNQNYDGVECDINKVSGFTTKNLHGLDGEIASESFISFRKLLSPQVLDHLKPAGSAEFAHRLDYSIGKDISKSSSSSTMANDSEVSNNFISSRQAVVMSQDSFGDTSGKVACQKEVPSEHQTKHKVDSTSDSDFQLSEYQYSAEKVIDASNTETHVTSYSSSDECTSIVLSDMIASNTVGDVSSSTLSIEAISPRSLNLVFSPRDVSEVPGGNMSTQSANTSVILTSTVTATTAVEFQGFPVDSLRKPSINIWTNGGLLGLEPSKPPDIGVPNAYCIDKIYDDRLSADSQPCASGNQIESGNLLVEEDKSNRVVSFPEKNTFTCKVADKQSDSMFSKQHSKNSIQASLFRKDDKDQNSYYDVAMLDIDRVKGKEGGSIFSEADMRSEPESNLSKKNNIGMPVGFSSLVHRFPVSSLQRKLSMTTISPFFELMNKDIHKLDCTSILHKHKERPKLAMSSTRLLQLGNKEDAAHGFSEKFVSSGLDSSGYQSPPIEHMNVSFNSMNNSNASKLRLEFCNIHQRGNMEGVMFPSFQLLSESFHPVTDGVLESDDDTFCRSCSYSSDDLLTLHSESDGEMQGEDGLYVSNRIEETCSISSSIDEESNVSGVNLVSYVTNLKHGTDALSFTSSDIIDLPSVSSSEIS